MCCIWSIVNRCHKYSYNLFCGKTICRFNCKNVSHAYSPCRSISTSLNNPDAILESKRTFAIAGSFVIKCNWLQFKFFDQLLKYRVFAYKLLQFSF